MISNGSLNNRDIICFGASTWDYPGFQQTSMKYLSENNRILYVLPIGTRKIVLSFETIKKCIEKAKRMMFNEIVEEKNVTFLNPKLLPFIYNPLIENINKKIIGSQILSRVKDMKLNDYILWIGTPTAFFMLDVLDPKFIIYNPVDRFSEFPFVNRTKIKQYERIIAEKSDIILCTSEAIGEDLAPYNQRSRVLHHWVDTSHFEKGLQSEWIPEDIAKIEPPILGYYGTTASGRLDIDLLRSIAIRYPKANVVVIGSRPEGTAKLNSLSNVHFLGRKKFDVIPFYLKRFTVCLIPFLVNDLTRAIDPIKLREYLSMGKPVVSVDLPEIRKLAHLMFIAKDREDFLDKVRTAMDEDSPQMRQLRMEEAKNNDVVIRLKELSEWLAGIVPDRGMRVTSAGERTGEQTRC
jgi:glycosyltransferase involved in cell wall biosynthesis